MFDVRQLQVLVEVARTGSYTEAAATLGYTQPAVSYQMKRLRQAVGSPLVTRAGRRLRLTQTGEALVGHADAIFSVLRAADQDIASRTARRRPGPHRLLPERLCGPASQVIVRLRQEHPEVRMTVVQPSRWRRAP
ncbi:LysR family transcriptional regulator [Streptomyces sp. M19]